MLMRAGYVLDERAGTWSRPGYGGIAYSDGDETEGRIDGVVKGARDLSVLSEELRQHCVDWPSLYHLSSLRANILRPFERHLGGDVLEIGAGCGAITRYLGECGGNVLALEGSPRRAGIARARTRELNNVNIVAERFDDFQCGEKFDVVTLIGVLEYANLFTVSANPALSMLERARSFLKPDGFLIIAIENQLGLKYFAGAAEDHVGRPMYGVEGHYRADGPQTFGRKVIADLLLRAGYGRTSILAPFPDYKLPVSIVAEDSFAALDFDATALATQSVPHDPQLPNLRAFSPELVWPTIVENGLALDLSNSFLIAASNGDRSVLEASSLAWHYSTGRRKAFCKETCFTRTQAGPIEVRYRRLVAPGAAPTDDASLVNFQVPEKSAYALGRPLSQDIVEILSRDGWTFKEVRQFFRRYIHILETILEEVEPGEKGARRIDVADCQLPGFFFDIVPHNLIVSADGASHLIDKEWDLTGGISAGFLVFRSLLNIISMTGRIGHSSEAFEATRLGLVTATMEAIGWPMTQKRVADYVELEAAIQFAVQGGTGKLDLLRDWLTKGELVRSNLSQRAEELRQELSQTVAENERQLEQLNQTIEQRDGEIARLGLAIAALHASTSWKLTAPLRVTSWQMSRARRALRLLPEAITRRGGVGLTVRRIIRVLRRDGLQGVLRRLGLLRGGAQPIVGGHSSADEGDAVDWNIVPYYVDPRLDAQAPQCPDKLSVAVHLHVFGDDRLEEAIERLANIPCSFDLYVSVLTERDTQQIVERLRERLPQVEQLSVEQTPGRGRNLASLIIQFGERLSQYAIIGHFHTEKSLCGSPSDGGKELLDYLLGPTQSTGGRIAHFFGLLQSSAKIIYPEARAEFLKDETDWGDSYGIAQSILERHTALSIDAFPRVEFPEGGMFWARGACLHEFLKLPLSFNDIPDEPSADDGSLGDALERLILIFAFASEGRYLRLHRGDSIQDYRAYEERQDFSGSIVHDHVKVLAYYLPQFHPIPENDEWHGKGFTEWTKVRAANPLFEGHYQQHIPHPDIGYYLLDSAETLRVQADLMRTAGVHGMVFYHYWFGGRMILEHPARMLLDAPDVAMPYCFCWANENWTRRWDGNESEILLAQNYSPEDARAFIRYLIPFFQDSRHLRVEGRPVLFVYRPSSIPDIAVYVDIWAEECRAAGLRAPYLVAVLTRGAAHPGDFKMDAGVERVLHDWTDGEAAEIKTTLRAYAPFNGNVLSYDQVASFYEAQTEAKDFTYFRALVPIWDNTARYGSEAHVVHGSTPARFQTWLESAIRYSQKSLPVDRRLVLVNAWNEWAEGAHLEPDTRYGYAYLNAVGRALSNVPYSAQFNPNGIRIDGTRVHLAFPPSIRKLLAQDAVLAQRFFGMLARSSIFSRCVITVDAEFDGRAALPAKAGTPQDADLVLEFRKLSFFGPRTLEKMLQTALVSKASAVVPNFYQRDWPLVPVTANGSIRSADACQAPFVLFPATMPRDGLKNVRMRTDAQCFVAEPNTVAMGEMPIVTTIIRIHRSADFELLRNALCCLAAMRNCICVPLISAQDLSDQQTRALEALLDDLAWYPGYPPRIDHYRSDDGRGDLRSRMLSESLRKVETRYVGFLDYDDLLMSNAYEWLIGRLHETEKAVAFGRVYSTTFSNATGVWLERSRRYENGYSYEDFVANNHAPLHSFLIDLSRIDLTDIVYHDDQRYMEDYFLTLQIFKKDNCDWDGLKLNFYIGDYIHSVDRAHTLAFVTDSERQAKLRDPEYRVCEGRINELRRKLVGARTKT
jgi:lipopolysaccharide biosynthesis protein/SAM-dependent methyltransferase